MAKRLAVKMRSSELLIGRRAPLIALVVVVVGAVLAADQCGALWLAPDAAATQQQQQADKDDYILLRGDELVRNDQILSYLVGASKEEIEEIVEANPALQAALLNKVRTAINERPPDDAQSQPQPQQPVGVAVQASAHKDLGAPGGALLSASASGNAQAAAYDTTSAIAQAHQSKMDALRGALGAKASSLFKIGGKLKKKLRKLGFRRRNNAAANSDNNIEQNNNSGGGDDDDEADERPSRLRPHLPHLHMSVSAAHQSSVNAQPIGTQFDASANAAAIASTG